MHVSDFVTRVQKALEELLPIGARACVLIASAWDEPVEGNSQPNDRQREVAAARRLEAEVKRSLGTQHSSVLTSVSHSRSGEEGAHWVIVVGVTGSQIRGVGVDLEFASRKFDEAVLTRVSSPQEPHLGLPALARWTLKEAAFKSDPRNSGRVLADYHLVAVTQVKGPQGLHRVALLSEQGLWISLAIFI